MKALPPDTVRLLSSSQVIVSVLNVVKELIENSLDAGATSLEVKLENYGLDRIEVRDNGSGIKAADAPVMAVKHYTSKLSSHEDLEHLETYGFRGEALGSICAVSEVTITSRTSEDELSTRYTLDVRGHVVSQKPSHLGRGTTVCALKLFKNLPVRRQFYSNTKKCKEELKKVQDLLMAYAVIKPELRVVLTHNKVVAWQKARVSDHAAALTAVLGPAVTNKLSPVRYRHRPAEISIDGFFPKLTSDLDTTSSCGTDKTFIYVNNRPVHHRETLKLIRQYYAAAAQGSRESAGRRYPILMMNISVPASSVDINLTPDKMHVMFQNKDAVLSAVESALNSLYGSSAAGNQGEDSGRGHPAAAPPEAPEGSAEDAETSTLTSSSSSSDDWINRSLGDLGVASGEIPAESWAAGTAFWDAASGGHLEPVRLRPGVVEGDAAPRRPGNAIVEKMPRRTAYDLIGERPAPRPLSALLEQDSNPSAGPRDAAAAAEERWERHGEEERRKYEEKAQKNLESYDQQSERAPAGSAPERVERQKADALSTRLRAVKRKAPPSNQRTLDEHVSSRPEVKKNLAKISRPVRFSLEALRRSLQLDRRSNPSTPGPRAVNPLPSHGAWVVSEGPRLLLLNPFRVQEALLFKRLSENNVLPAASLQTPLLLTDGVLGGLENMEVLLRMEKSGPNPHGESRFTDARLVANGFEIRLTPGSSPRPVEVTAMCDLMPFYGVSDLKEILEAVKKRPAATVQQCRPLKVTNYLEAEAVRMVRQLPLNMSREDVTDILARMGQELEGALSAVCLHGRPFCHGLVEVPETERDARRILSNTT